jgi:hypothetical protein
LSRILDILAVILSHIEPHEWCAHLPDDTLLASSFGVSHTLFAPGFVPCLSLMTMDHCITADFATDTTSKLYRFHYNLCAAVPVIWSAMKRISSPQITGKEACKLFRQRNRLSRGFRLTC